jgi:transposase
MRQKSMPEKGPAARVVKDIRRATRRHFSADDLPRKRLVPRFRGAQTGQEIGFCCKKSSENSVFGRFQREK